jgi:hypothetical protein
VFSQTREPNGPKERPNDTATATTCASKSVTTERCVVANRIPQAHHLVGRSVQVRRGRNEGPVSRRGFLARLGVGAGAAVATSGFVTIHFDPTASLQAASANKRPRRWSMAHRPTAVRRLSGERHATARPLRAGADPGARGAARRWWQGNAVHPRTVSALPEPAVRKRLPSRGDLLDARRHCLDRQ